MIRKTAKLHVSFSCNDQPLLDFRFRGKNKPFSLAGGGDRDCFAGFQR